ncbi:hypothetical protein BJ912DRAFT_971462 [Pholiota molesta]|nr:hypothetical protein BJ912DRAFT_971462 [Pholiota molesta]
MDQGERSASQPTTNDVAARRVIRAENAAKRERALQERRLCGAADLYAQSVNIHGPKPVLLSNMAAAYLKLELFEEAEWACTISLEYDPTAMKSRFRRAIARKKLKHFEAAKRALGTASESETEDCKHVGNRTACRFYNKGDCRRGTECKFSHAPDAKSVRDELGRNVCVHFLLDDCQFGNKCLYSHSRTNLPAEGWWNDSRQRSCAKEFSGQIERSSDHAKLHELMLRNPMARTYASLPERKAVCDHLVRQLAEAKTKLQQRKPKDTPKPFILVLSFEHEDYHLNINRHLFTALQQKAKVIYLRGTAWATQALEYLDSPSLTAVLITDVGITKKKYARVLQKLVDYTKDGGCVAIGCQFSSFISPPDYNKFIKTSWGLDWKFGSYFRQRFPLNPLNEIVQNNPSLHGSYSMKAVHMSNIEPEMAIYWETSQSNVADASKREAPAVCAPVGQGRLCFLGDVNSEDQSTNTMLAMLGVLDPPKTQGRPSGHSTVANPRYIRGLDADSLLPPRITDKFLLLLELEGDDHYKRKRIEVKFVYESDFREVINLLRSADLYGVYVVDEGNGKYAREGGLVVFGGLFGQNADREAFSFIWSFFWYCEAQLNRQHETAVRYPSLSEAFSMDAVRICNFAPGDVFYKTCLNEDERRLRARSAVEDAPILRTRVGRGRVGYIGGVGAPPQVLLAMLDLPFPVPLKEVVPDSTKFLVILTEKEEQVLTNDIPDFMKDVKGKVEDLVGVLAMDAPRLLLPQNAYLLSKLVEYSKNGGTIVFGSTFSATITSTQFKPFFHQNWGLEWEIKTMFNEEISLKRNFESPLFQGKKAKDIKLPKTMRITKPMAVYFPSTRKEFWNPETNVYAASILYADVADGHLGYIGTTNVDGETRNIIYTMFGLI